MKKQDINNVCAIPGFYNPANALDPAYRPDPVMLLEEASRARKFQKISGYNADAKKVFLLVIDNQKDFCFAPPFGSLYVAGAEQDSQRLAEFIYRNIATITQIIPTMDTHMPWQIFFPEFHVDSYGNYPASGTSISSADYKTGKWQPNPLLGGNPADNAGYVIHYCEELERAGKYSLMIWPHHCLVGTPGHTLVGTFEEALLYHSFLRGSPNKPELKGSNQLTEHYSVLRPEVATLKSGAAIGGAQKNTKLIKELMDADMVIITGQAKSHCLAWTISDLLNEIMVQDKTLVEKVYLLEDCTSPVIIPGVADFTTQADQAFAEFDKAGMHVVKSTDPIASWPGVSGIFNR